MWWNLVSAENCVLFCVCAQSCLTLWDPMDCSPSGSSAHGILHARILEWAATPSSRGLSQLRDRTHVSYIVSRFFTVWATREAHIHILENHLVEHLKQNNIANQLYFKIYTHLHTETKWGVGVNLGENEVMKSREENIQEEEHSSRMKEYWRVW